MDNAKQTNVSARRPILVESLVKGTVESQGRSRRNQALRLPRERPKGPALLDAGFSKSGIRQRRTLA